MAGRDRAPRGRAGGVRGVRLNPAGPRILIVTWTCGFPDSGTAETVRLRSFAAGLKTAGADVSVHVVSTTAPGPGALSADHHRGEWRGVPYEYMHGAARPVSGWLRRRGLEVLGVWRMCRTVRTAARASTRTAVILFSPALRTILPIRLACTFARVSLVDERDEFPFVYRGEPGPLGRLWRSAYNALAFRLYDGHIVISTLLEDFVRARARAGAWIVRVPILVDVEAFSCASAPLDGLVGYAAGELSRSDELFQLMRAVATLAPAHRSIRARIVGGAGPAELAGLRRESADLGVADRLDFVGTVGPDDVPAHLCECAALALPRTRALFSEAGFPTKLGEYLATGRPVVVTATGDIPRYLRADVDAFLVPPDDPDAFASALERALYGPAAAGVGRAGREVARAQFDPVAHMRSVLDALEGSWTRP